MIGRLKHVAMAVADLNAAAAFYRDVLGAQVTAPENLPQHGVRTVFVRLPNTQIELLEPLGEDSPLTKFLAKNPAGGIHHVCYEVDNIARAGRQLEAHGMRILGPPRRGAHGKTVIFLHPKDSHGALIELEEI